MSDDTTYASLREYMDDVRVIDAHEHLPTEESHIAGRADFYSLFKHYCRGDLVSAGAGQEEFLLWEDEERDEHEKWRVFKPYWEAIRSGGYARSARIVIRDILEIPGLEDDTYEDVGSKLRQLRKPGEYDLILKDKCGLSACIQCWRYGEPGPDYFYHLAPSPELVDVRSVSDLQTLGERCGIPVHSLDDLCACIEERVAAWAADPAVVGIKSAHAYTRPIEFSRTESVDAKRILRTIFDNSGRSVSLQEAIPLQDYLMRRVVAAAETAELPMVFHTGLQAGNFGRLADTNPLLLQSLIEDFPKMKIDLFHAGIPFTREAGILAKYFPGVHLNMAWTHIINPAMSRTLLSEWFDMVPNTKIFGFGGDYHIVEKVYGHLTIAKDNIARVLAEKVSGGIMDIEEARRIAGRLLRDNPAEFYGLPSER